MIQQLIRSCRFTVRVSGLVLFLVASLGAQASVYCGKRAVSSLQMTQDGQTILAWVEDMSGTCDAMVALDVDSGHTRWSMSANMPSVVFALSRDARRLAVSHAGKAGAGRGNFFVLDAQTGKLISSMQEDRANGLVLTGGDVVSVVLSPDGNEVYATLRNGWLAAWDSSTGKPLFTQDPPESRGSSGGGRLDISPDGKQIAWEREKGIYLLALPPEHAGGRDIVATVRGHVPGRDLHDARFSPDGHTLAMAQGAVPGNTLLWSIEPLHALLPILGCAGEMAWSPDNRSIACQTNSAVQLVTLKTPREVLGSKQRSTFESPQTPIAAGSRLLLYQQQSARDGAISAIVLSTFEKDNIKMISLPESGAANQ